MTLLGAEPHREGLPILAQERMLLGGQSFGQNILPIDYKRRERIANKRHEHLVVHIRFFLVGLSLTSSDMCLVAISRARLTPRE